MDEPKKKKNEKNNPKIIVYTSIIGNKDKNRNDIMVFNSYKHFKDPVRNAKIYKVLPHLFLDTDYSIWVDGNVFLNVQPEEMIKKMGNKDIAVFEYTNYEPVKDIYDEANTVIELNLDNPKIVLEQINRYKKSGYKNNEGLGYCFMIIRKHSKKIDRLNEQWWAEICRGSRRDQLSFPFVFGNEVKYIDWPKNKHCITRPGHKITFLKKVKQFIFRQSKKIKWLKMEWLAEITRPS